MTASADEAARVLAENIPAGARAVMEIGCHLGQVAATLKQRNPGIRYMGVEQAAGCGPLAHHLDAVRCVDVEANPLPFGGEMFDCIIHNDIMCRLADPAALLRVHALALKPGGVLLLRLRDSARWAALQSLFLASAGSRETGMSQEFRQAILDAGLFLSEPVVVAEASVAFGELVAALAPALVALGRDPDEFAREAAPGWQIWTATKAKPAPLSVISTMLVPVGGVSHVRVSDPMAALSSCPDVSARVTGDRVPRAEPGAAAVLVLHRPAFVGSQGLAALRQAIEFGHVTICEFDDHPGFIPVLDRDDVYNFNAMHAVQTSTQDLADVLREDNPEVRVFPNAVRTLPDIVNFTDPGRLTVFCSGINREEDWTPLIPAMNAVARQMGERLHFRVVNDSVLFEQLETGFKSYTPLCDYATYRHLLARSEISCMPLRDNIFNRSKSDLKFVEAASHRVMALASRVVYGNTIVEGQTGAVFSGAEEFHRKLLHYAAEPLLARRIADEARDYVAGHRMLDAQVSRRVRWYRSMWERRDALGLAALDRVPDPAPVGVMSGVD
jgi:SAM-dependent methyltransferase